MNVERSASEADNPWPGLATFTEEQAGLFHGRDAEIRDLTKRAERNALTVLFGQSGLGKSSLLQAGVFPRLRANSYWPIYVRLDHSPGAPPPAEQIKALVQADTVRAGRWTNPGSAKPGESLWEFFHHRDDRLVSPGGRIVVPVLVFDQFEELFTLGAGSGSERARAFAFMSELAELVENRPSEKLVARLEDSSAEMDAFDFSRTEYRVVITLREDYLPHLESLKTAMPALMENRMRLARMTGTQALEAVVKPGGALVTEEVARAIVEFVAGAKGGSIERLAELDVEPPLLSVICRELNERRRALGSATISADLVTGNRREILTDFYERSVGDLPEAMRRFVEDRLLTKSGFRDNLALETALEEPGVTQPLIDTLVSRRLLRIEDRLGVQRVELTHDVLAEVIRASRDARQQRLLLEEAQRREEQARVETARRTRRVRFVLAGLTTAVVALSIGAVFGIRAQRQSAAQASSTDFVFGSRLLDEGKLSEGLAYLVRAGRKDPLNELVAPRLLSSLTLHNFALPVGKPLPLPVPALWGGYSPDGRRIYLQTEDDVLRSIDVATWQLEPPHDFGKKIIWGTVRGAENSPIVALQFADRTLGIYRHQGGWVQLATIAVDDDNLLTELSPDGRWLAVRGIGIPTIRIWDTASGELRATLAVGNGVFQFSPDSHRLAAYGGSNQTIFFSVPDGKQMGEPILHDRENSRGRRFSRDGKKLFVTHPDGLQAYETDTGKKSGPFLEARIGRSSSVIFSPDGSLVVVVRQERNVEVLSVSTGKPAFPALEHGGVVFDATFSRDGRVLLTNATDGFFRVWDMTTGTSLTEPMLKQDRYTPATLSPDGRDVVVFTGMGPVVRLRVGLGAAAPLFLPRPPGSVILVNFHSAPPARLLWLMPDRAKAIDVTSGREVTGGFSYPAPLPTWPRPSANSNVQISRSGNGGTLGPGEPMIARFGPGDLRLWKLGEDGVVGSVRFAEPPPSENATFFLNPMGRMAAAAADANSVRIWNLGTGRVINTIVAPRPLRGGVRGRSTLNSIRVSFDEKRIAVATADDHIFVYEGGTGTKLCELELTGRATLQAFIFTYDGAGLITGDSWGGVQHWDIASGKMLSTYQAHRSAVTRFDFSNDNRYAMSLSDDGIAQMWDLTRGTPVGAPLSYSGRANIAAFNPDNTRALTTSADGTARISDLATGLPITDPLPHGRTTVTNAAFSPDGRFISTRVQGTENASRLWSAVPPSNGVRTPEWLLRLASVCAGQVLTNEGKTASATTEIARFEELKTEIARLPDDTPYMEWGRWVLFQFAFKMRLNAVSHGHGETKNHRCRAGEKGAVGGRAGDDRAGFAGGASRLVASGGGHDLNRNGGAARSRARDRRAAATAFS